MGLEVYQDSCRGMFYMRTQVAEGSVYVRARVRARVRACVCVCVCVCMRARRVSVLIFRVFVVPDLGPVPVPCVV